MFIIEVNFTKYFNGNCLLFYETDFFNKALHIFILHENKIISKSLVCKNYVKRFYMDI